MSYCMYLRKSRADLEAEARGEGETLSRHLHTLTLLAARLNIDVAPSAIYREIVSGDTIAARPVMQRLLEEVQRGMWEGVLCTEVERLARGDTIGRSSFPSRSRRSRSVSAASMSKPMAPPTRKSVQPFCIRSSTCSRIFARRVSSSSFRMFRCPVKQQVFSFMKSLPSVSQGYDIPP